MITSSDCHKASDITEDDGQHLRGAEESAPWIEMGMPPYAHVFLDNRSRRARYVRQNVPVPAYGLLENDTKEQNKGSILANFVEKIGRNTDFLGVFVSLRRNVVEVFVNLVGVDVMTSVRRFPREVRSEEEGMQSEADGSVES